MILITTNHYESFGAEHVRFRFLKGWVTAPSFKDGLLATGASRPETWNEYSSTIALLICCENERTIVRNLKV